MKEKILFTLQIADNALVHGHRLSEWCGSGPILEQDIALTNIALDHLGQARSLYQYAAEQFNALPVAEKKELFSSPALQNLITNNVDIDEDDLAYLRDGWDFRNVLLVEQSNEDWGYTVAKAFYYDVYNHLFYTALLNSKDETLAAIAEKSLKEVTYHLRWSSEWMVRLGDGTEESKQRVQDAANSMWMYTGEMFGMSAADNAMLAAGTGIDLLPLKPEWDRQVQEIFKEATLNLPTNTWMQHGGKDGRHTEKLGYILADLQFMQRAYPGMEW